MTKYKNLNKQIKSLSSKEIFAKNNVKQKEKIWLQNNIEAIKSYNEQLIFNGLFSDRLRRF